MARQKLTKRQIAQREYSKALKTLNKNIRDLQAQGYVITDKQLRALNVKDVSEVKNITQAKKLKSTISKTKLKEKALFQTATGATISGREALRTERAAAQRKAKIRKTAKAIEKAQREEAAKAALPQEGEMIIDYIYRQMDGYTDNRSSAMDLRKVMDAVISMYGIEQVEENFKKQEAQVIEYMDKALFYKPNTSQHQEAVNELIRVAKGSAITQIEASQIDEILNGNGALEI